MKTYLLTIPMRIYRFASRMPNKVAVIDSDLKKYTYRTLNAMADSIKRMMPTDKPGRVGILTKSGINQIAAVISVIKNGGMYVPLDPALNGSAIRRAVKEARVDFVITDECHANRLGDIPAVILPDFIDCKKSENTAPINFDKKSVACAMPVDGNFEELSCEAVRKHARYLCDEFEISSSDVVLQSSLPTSPMYLAEVFATMMKGATLAILPEQCRGYAKAVADFSERAGVTIICGSRPMVDDIGLLKRLPSKLRIMIEAATDRVSNALAGFNNMDTWRGFFTARRTTFA